MHPTAIVPTRRPTGALRIGTLWIPLLLATLAGRAADGALDMSFNPTQEAWRWSYGMTAIEGRLYVGDATHGVVRLREDGTGDDGWRLGAPLMPPAAALARTPFGDWVAVDLLGRAFLERADGAWNRLPDAPSLSPSYWPISLLFGPGDSILVSGRARFGADGRRQPEITYRQHLVGAGFNDSPRLLAGALNVAAVQDGRGRLILGGTFRQAGGVERLGLARFFEDGTLDSTWNPGPSLGLALVPTNQLNRVPYQLALGPDDSVWVSLWVADADAPGPATLRLVHVSAEGTVLADFPSGAMGGDPPPIVQPDGRLLVMGRFDRWGDTPATGLVRLNPDGTVDSSFEVVLTGNRVLVRSAAADAAGRLWIAGDFDSVNGVQRPGLARIFAWTPEPAAPEVRMETAAPRLATNEVLLLRARVAGIPPPDLQWFQNGEAIPGATNQGLRLVADQVRSPAQFQLVASNASGQRPLDFPTVSFAVRSPVPGRLDAGFDRRMTHLSGITQVVPLPDGRLLVGAGRWEPTGPAGPRVARLLPDGSPDPSFGHQGVVSGLGTVEGLSPAADGGLLVFGQLTELAGQPVSGIGQLDGHGRFVPRDFPPLDIPHVSAVLPLEGGGMVWAGRFTRIGTQPAFRLARLDPGWNPDPLFSSPLERWQFVDALGLDAG
ncbi:MAG: hypothetical protein J0L84_17760, partial [Verrucomicrobia bacterium]|nr:hypothetical protein [Verrucomicrobiota bacterium]